MYEVQNDTYCYPGTTVLKNKLGLTDADDLAAFETEITDQRASEALPEGNLDYEHYKAIHYHLFQDVYDWAGKPRSVRILEGTSAFCYPEYIDREMVRLFEQLADRNYLDIQAPDDFAKAAAHFLAELNAIHPFREGNGRTQLTFLTLLAEQAGHPLHLERLDPEAILATTIESFAGDETALEQQITSLL